MAWGTPVCNFPSIVPSPRALRQTKESAKLWNFDGRSVSS